MVEYTYIRQEIVTDDQKKDIWLAQVCDEPVYMQEQNLCGEGTVDIVYIIMSKVWTLKQH